MEKVVLCILDGVGIRKENHGNAFLQAKTPHFDFLWDTYPHSYLSASGESVGLPEGQMGNSEVGHMNIGAGRIVYQPLQFINEQIKNKQFFENDAFKKVIDHVLKNHSKLHIFGLLSDGGIHSSIDHLMAFLDLCSNMGVERVFLHVCTDGRDTKPDCGYQYIEQLESKLKELSFGKIASISGRYYAMDRDNRWDRIERAYRVLCGEGEQKNIEDIFKSSYEKGIYDEFIEPTLIDKEGALEDNDGLFVFNYRPDRLREMLTVLTNPSFSSFSHKTFQNLLVVTMMPVSEQVFALSAYQHQNLENTLGKYLSFLGKKQLRIAETEKYAHVTHFFDGAEDIELDGSKRILISSPKVTTYDLSPDMSAKEITESLLKEMDFDYDLVVLNYANGDMLGHTGNLKATIQSIETMDMCLGKLYEKSKEKGYTLFVFADHGNCEYMLDEQNHVITSHTTSLVPFIVTDSSLKVKDGKLADIAPTVLKYLHIPIPSEMTGEILIIERF